MSGILYVVATPIGNLDDITIRAINVLKEVHLILAEDTRHSRQLLKHLQIEKPLLSLHEHNEEQRISKIKENLSQGYNLALISDAGTPLISDPGYNLISSLREENFNIVPIPGACALIAALCVSGLPTDSFIFMGFLAAKENKRKEQLSNLALERRTMIFYESVYRIKDMLADAITIFGANRIATLAREISKKYETIKKSTLNDLLQSLKENEQQIRGEFVVIITGNFEEKSEDNYDIDHLLSLFMDELPTKQAVNLAVKITGIKKNIIYKKALSMKT